MTCANVTSSVTIGQVAPAVGLEPTTKRLTAARSTTELRRSEGPRGDASRSGRAESRAARQDTRGCIRRVLWPQCPTPTVRASRRQLPLDPIISVEALRRRLDGADLRVVDVRWYLGRPERRDGRLPRGPHPGRRVPGRRRRPPNPPAGPNGGRHPLPDPGAFRDRLAAVGIGDDHLVVAYDDCGGWVAARLWWMLDDLGHRNVAVLDGGYPAWTDAGLPVATDVPSPAPASLSLRDHWTRVIGRDALRERLGSVTLLTPARENATGARPSRSTLPRATSRPPAARPRPATWHRTDDSGQRQRWPNASANSVLARAQVRRGRQRSSPTVARAFRPPTTHSRCAVPACPIPSLSGLLERLVQCRLPGCHRSGARRAVVTAAAALHDPGTRPIAIVSALPQELAELRAAVERPAGSGSGRTPSPGAAAWTGSRSSSPIPASARYRQRSWAPFCWPGHARGPVLFTGVAGGLDPNLHVGDVVVADRLIQHDAGVARPDGLEVYQAGHLLLLPTEGLGYAPDPDLLARVLDRLHGLTLEPLRGRQPSVVAATILTGDVFVDSESLRRRLHDAVRRRGRRDGGRGPGPGRGSVRRPVPGRAVALGPGRCRRAVPRAVREFLAVACANSARVVRHLLPLF